jgi:hypothetical protein
VKDFREIGGENRRKRFTTGSEENHHELGVIRGISSIVRLLP